MSINSREMFFSTAMNYYVAGRFAVIAGLNPVAGNLLHHAIEMFLKGGLSETKTLAEMKALGHSLADVWDEFKAQANDPALDQFDSLVSEVHSFEGIRYPDRVLAEGMSSMIDLTRDSASAAVGGSRGPVPGYEIVLEEIDEFVGKVFATASVNPEYALRWLIKPIAKKYLSESNTVPAFAINVPSTNQPPRLWEAVKGVWQAIKR